MLTLPLAWCRALAHDHPGAAVDPACPPALALLAVTVRVLELGERVAAGDVAAAAEVSALAALLARERG